MTLLTVPQAAARLGVSRRTVQRAIAEGRIRAHGDTFRLVDERELARFEVRGRGRPRKPSKPSDGPA